MSVNENDGGPAFPQIERLQKLNVMGTPDLGSGFSAVGAGGMSLRDYFAAKAMQGMLAGPVGSLGEAAIARWAYRHADAMLAERAK